MVTAGKFEGRQSHGPLMRGGIGTRVRAPFQTFSVAYISPSVAWFPPAKTKSIVNASRIPPRPNCGMRRQTGADRHPALARDVSVEMVLFIVCFAMWLWLTF